MTWLLLSRRAPILEVLTLPLHMGRGKAFRVVSGHMLKPGPAQRSAGAACLGIDGIAFTFLFCCVSMQECW